MDQLNKMFLKNSRMAMGVLTRKTFDPPPSLSAQNVPWLLRSHIQSFGTLRQLLKFSTIKQKTKKRLLGGQRGFPEVVNISFFVSITPSEVSEL